MIDDLLKKFSKQHKFVSQEMLYGMYAIVSQDIEDGNRDKGVWAKAFADAKGDEQVAKAGYIELMVERLILAKQAEEELVDQVRLSQSWNATKQKVNKGIGDAVDKLDRAAHKVDEAMTPPLSQSPSSSSDQQPPNQKRQTKSSHHDYHEPSPLKRKAAEAPRKKQDFYELWWAQLILWPTLFCFGYFSYITYQAEGLTYPWIIVTIIAFGAVGSMLLMIEALWKFFKKR